MKYLLHRDQVHRDTYFDPISIALLNTSQMQRLGRVYQLGFAHLVYRGGTHTRLSHVMGAAHVSEILVDALKNNYDFAIKGQCLPLGAQLPEEFLPQHKSKNTTDNIEDRWDVLKHLTKWGALLHDIGHVPFGHTLEDEFADIYKKHDSFESERMGFLWNEVHAGTLSPIKDIFCNKINAELYPSSFNRLKISGIEVWQIVMMICLFKKGASKISETDIGSFKAVYNDAYESTHGSLFHQYMADIVSDTICADYIDYIQRDTLNVGLDSIKETRIIHSYFVGRDVNDNELRMALSLVDKGNKPKLSICTAAKNMVRHRFDLAEIIYYHKTKASASAMLAKVFSLIGSPQEVGAKRATMHINEIKEKCDLLLGKKDYLKNLKNSYQPDALLHPSIGDETLLYWLQEKAWEKIEKSIANKNEKQIAASLLALSLLEGITERNLYKVAISIDSKIVREIQSEHPKRVETEIGNILDKYRKSSESRQENRDSLEKDLCSDINWPEGTFICYVPDRKSQAKGIDTGAFDSDGNVITLGEHTAVIEDVKMLNNDYKELWRFLLFVHPDYKKNIDNNSVELSKAADLLFKRLFPLIKIDEKVESIKKSCWFHYIPKNQRSAANLYVKTICAEGKTSIPWKFFDLAIATLEEANTTPIEHADRANLIKTLIESGTFDSDDLVVEFIKELYGDAGSLNKAIYELLLDIKEFSRNGLPTEEGRLEAIRTIADKMIKSKA